MLIAADDCLAATGTNDVPFIVLIAVVLIASGAVSFFVARTRTGRVAAILLPILIVGLTINGSHSDSAVAANNCESSSSNSTSTPDPTETPTETPSPTETPTETPTPTPTPTADPTGLTIQFRPIDSGQYVWYCPSGAEADVCVSPSRTLDWTTFQNAGGVQEDYFIPTADLVSENSGTGYFNISVKALGTPNAGSKIGPGVGITCLQRATATITGTSDGVLSGDWTGAGLPWYHFWYTGCSLDAGVDSATFYAYSTDAP